MGGKPCGRHDLDFGWRRLVFILRRAALITIDPARHRIRLLPI